MACELKKTVHSSITNIEDQIKKLKNRKEEYQLHLKFYDEFEGHLFQTIKENLKENYGDGYDIERMKVEFQDIFQYLYVYFNFRIADVDERSEFELKILNPLIQNLNSKNTDLFFSIASGWKLPNECMIKVEI